MAKCPQESDMNWSSTEFEKRCLQGWRSVQRSRTPGCSPHPDAAWELLCVILLMLLFFPELDMVAHPLLPGLEKLRQLRESLGYRGRPCFKATTAEEGKEGQKEENIPKYT